MTELTPWRRIWKDINVAMEAFENDQAKAKNRLISTLSLAMMRYGEKVDSNAFDELGQPIGLKESEV